MLLRLRSDLPASEVEAIVHLAKGLGYRARFLDEGRRLLHLEGRVEPDHRTRFHDRHGVEDVVEAGGAELFARGSAPDRVVSVAGAAFGGGAVSLIAGPCAVEDRAGLFAAARAVRRAGAALLRGGAFKPRSSPYSFQGLGRRGLEMLAEVKAEVGIGIVTEVLDVRDLEAVDAVADVLQVGSRSMTNYALLSELGRTRRPVLLKRGFMSTVREWLYAAEYILAGGNETVILCERGVRSFDSVTRNQLDVGAIAHLKRVTHLPVVADPSHAAGRGDLVPALARAGLAAGADGLLVEVHPSPGEARSDGEQAISPATFARIVQDARALVQLDGRRLVTLEPEHAPTIAEGPVPSAGSVP